MNEKGHKESLVASHPRNKNALKYGVHSPDLLRTAAEEIAAHLLALGEFSPGERVSVNEVARWVALLEVIDRDRSERGIVDRTGKARYLLALRIRASAQLEHWLSRIEHRLTPEQTDEEILGSERSDYIRELKRIALGQDHTAVARDRLAAIRELLALEADEAPAPTTIQVHLAPDGTLMAGDPAETTRPEGRPEV